MQICIALLLMAAGGGLYALHTRICYKRACEAYQSGFNQAQKEAKIRQEAVNQYRGPLRPVVPLGPEEMGGEATMERRSHEVLTPDFMDKLHRDGRAVVRVK